MESAEPKKEAGLARGGICASCQERIRREAMGEQKAAPDTADKELSRHGVTPSKKSF
jgi:hypothetical protein